MAVPNPELCQNFLSFVRERVLGYVCSIVY
jgi:hypothetical protein